MKRVLRSLRTSIVLRRRKPIEIMMAPNRREMIYGTTTTC